LINEVTQISDSLLISSTMNSASPEDTLDVDGHITLTKGDRWIYSYTSGSFGYDLGIAGGWGGCFDGDTKIKTPTGHKNIEDIVIGDVVVSYNVATGTPTISTVLYNSVRTAPSQFVINGITVTSEHPLYTKRGYVPVRELRLTDELFDGTSWIPVTSIEKSLEPTRVYNLAVDNDHNYFADGILAKNKDTSARAGGELYLTGGAGSYGGADGNVWLAYDGFSADGYVIVSNAYYLPNVDGATGQVLTTDGAGYLYWDNVTSGISYFNQTGTNIIPATLGDSIALNGTQGERIYFDYPINNFSIYQDDYDLYLEIPEFSGLVMPNATGLAWNNWDAGLYYDPSNVGYELQLWANTGDYIGIYNDMFLYENKLWFDYPTTKKLEWNTTNSRFEFNDNLYVDGNVTADYFIGDGSQLTNIPTGVTNHSLLTDLNWDVAGHIINTDLAPNTTNAYSLGNTSNYWSALYSTNATIGNSTGNVTITPTGTTLFGTARVLDKYYSSYFRLTGGSLSATLGVDTANERRIYNRFSATTGGTVSHTGYIRESVFNGFSAWNTTDSIQLYIRSNTLTGMTFNANLYYDGVLDGAVNGTQNKQVTATNTWELWTLQPATTPTGNQIANFEVTCTSTVNGANCDLADVTIYYFRNTV